MVFDPWVCTTVIQSLDSDERFPLVSPIKPLEGYVERSRAINICRVHLGSQSNQEIDDLMGVTKACPMEWRTRFRILGVDVVGDIGVLKVLLK
jgi:hypothetical protein